MVRRKKIFIIIIIINSPHYILGVEYLCSVPYILVNNQYVDCTDILHLNIVFAKVNTLIYWQNLSPVL